MRFSVCLTFAVILSACQQVDGRRQGQAAQTDLSQVAAATAAADASNALVQAHVDAARAAAQKIEAEAAQLENSRW